MRSHHVKSKQASAKETWLKRGAALMQAKQFAEACACYGEAVQKFPTDSQLLYCQGVAHHQNKQLLEAIGCYSQALQHKMDFIEAFENLAEAQTELAYFDDALLSIRAAIALNPKKSLSHTRLARILVRLGQYDEAIEVATHALSLDASNAQAYMVRSNAYRGLTLLKHSIQDLRKAIALKPDHPDYVYNLSFDLLLNQEFDEGWECYEARFQTKNFLDNVAPMVAPRWNGSDSLEGKTILICPEQGLGDQIQFGRYALILKGMGAKVIMAVAPPLVDIMQSMAADIFVTSTQQHPSALPKHDLHIPLMSLPGIFKTDIDSIPCADSYIAPNASISEKWAARFSDKKKLQVGITWSGSHMHVNDHNRSMSLAQLQPLFDLDVDWHVLQTEIREADEPLLRSAPLQDWRPELTSLHETAGLLQQLDLLITVDTSVAHLSAALGCSTWIMLPFAPDFRWLLERTDSPWYPTVHLFRQHKPKDWHSVIQDVVHTLTQGNAT